MLYKLTRNTFFIVITILFTCIHPHGNYVFANNIVNTENIAEISLQSDKTTLSKNDILSLSIFIKIDTTKNQFSTSNVSIPGIEQFSIIKSSKQTKFESINGTSVIMHEINMQLLPKKTGNFVIGPVKLYSDSTTTKAESDTVTISVFNEKKLSTAQSNIKQITQEKINTKIYKTIKNYLLWILIILLLSYISYAIYKYNPDNIKNKETVKIKKKEHNENKEEHTRQKVHDNAKPHNENDFYKDVLNKINDYINNISKEKYKTQKEKIINSSIPENKKEILFSLIKLSNEAKFAPENKDNYTQIKKLLKQLQNNK